MISFIGNSIPTYVHVYIALWLLLPVMFSYFFCPSAFQHSLLHIGQLPCLCSSVSLLVSLFCDPLSLTGALWVATNMGLSYGAWWFTCRYISEDNNFTFPEYISDQQFSHDDWLPWTLPHICLMVGRSSLKTSVANGSVMLIGSHDTILHTYLTVDRSSLMHSYQTVMVTMSSWL